MPSLNFIRNGNYNLIIYSSWGQSWLLISWGCFYGWSKLILRALLWKLFYSGALLGWPKWGGGFGLLNHILSHCRGKRKKINSNIHWTQFLNVCPKIIYQILCINLNSSVYEDRLMTDGSPSCIVWTVLPLHYWCLEFDISLTSWWNVEVWFLLLLLFGG